MRGNADQISVFGLGYVGSVTAACFTKLGHKVVGVHVNPAKVEMLESGRTPVVGVENLKNEFKVSAWHVDGTCNEVRKFQGTVRFYE